MGSHSDCGDWDYDRHPERKKVTARSDLLQRLLIKWPRRFDRYGFDTRSGHRFMFSGMTPATCTCLAGNYRGSSTCAALTSYKVTVPADPRVGIDPRLVSWQMHELGRRCADACDAYEDWLSLAGPKTTAHAALLRFVQILCDALEQIFWIHPYANGNGHAGRLMVFALLTRYGFPPRHWAIDKKMPYSDALSQYRSGNKKPLISLLLHAMRP